jgi:hypothetical protein
VSVRVDSEFNRRAGLDDEAVSLESLQPIRPQRAFGAASETGRGVHRGFDALLTGLDRKSGGGVASSIGFVFAEAFGFLVW